MKDNNKLFDLTITEIIYRIQRMFVLLYFKIDI